MKKATPKCNWEDVKSKVDHRSPSLPVTKVTKPNLLNLIARETRLLDLANVELVRTLYKIHISHGKISSFRSWPHPQVKSNLQERRKAAEGIQEENIAMAFQLESVAPKVPTVKQLAKEWEHSKSLIKKKRKYPKNWGETTEDDMVATIPQPVDVIQYVTEKSLKYPDERPRVSIEVSLADFGPIGRMVAVLYSDFVPRTCENFLAFCDGEASHSYKGCGFYHIVPQYFCITGDVVHNRGLGGTSIYGVSFQHENTILQHGEPGVLSMDNTGDRRNSSQFLITFRPLHSMDGRYVAFGKITLGLKTVMAIESFGSKAGHPRRTLWISKIKEI